MASLTNIYSKVLGVILLGLFVLFFWPGGIPVIVGNQQGVYQPLLWGWIPSYLVFQSVVYLLIWFVSTVLVVIKYKNS